MVQLQQELMAVGNLYAYGNIGVGTVTPGTKLDVVDGGIRTDSSVSYTTSIQSKCINCSIWN